jgi:hypothetical protein
VLVQVTAQRIKAYGPEFFIAGQPHGGPLHRFGRNRQTDDPAILGAADQARVFEHAQVLHEAGQRHAMRCRQLPHGLTALLQRLQHRAAGRVGQRGKHGIQHLVLILNHMD